MKVVLLETMDNLGRVGEIVSVRSGYARNFLFPRKKAMAASARNLKEVAHQQMLMEHRMKKARKTSEDIRDALGREKFTISKKAGESEKLFGSVTTMDIEKALIEKDIKINRRSIELADPIKKLGQYEIPIKLDGDLEAKISVEVVAEAQ